MPDHATNRIGGLFSQNSPPFDRDDLAKRLGIAGQNRPPRPIGFNPPIAKSTSQLEIGIRGLLRHLVADLLFLRHFEARCTDCNRRGRSGRLCDQRGPRLA
jgi:hypothetical protein